MLKHIISITLYYVKQTQVYFQDLQHIQLNNSFHILALNNLIKDSYFLNIEF